MTEERKEIENRQASLELHTLGKEPHYDFLTGIIYVNKTGRPLTLGFGHNERAVPILEISFAPEESASEIEGIEKIHKEEEI